MIEFNKILQDKEKIPGKNFKSFAMLGFLFSILFLIISSVQQSQSLKNFAQTSPANPDSVNTAQSSVNGLTGAYFDNKDFTGKSITRTDPSINFVWWFDSPMKEIDRDTFSVRWTGKIKADYSETYTFFVKADDGVRLWVGDKLIIDRWAIPARATEYMSQPVVLQAGQMYDIKLEYFEDGWWSEVGLSWFSRTIHKQNIPQKNLFTKPRDIVDGDSSCSLAEAKLLGEGGSPDWSPSADKIVYNKKDANGAFELYVSNSDGSDVKCLSCTSRPGAPLVGKHKTNPIWHPSGNFILTSAEMDKHPAEFISRIHVLTDLFNNGLWSNLYATTPTGDKWYKLTDYSNTKTDGAMHEQFSIDGKKMVWSRLIQEATAQNPFGTWRMMLADFVVDQQGVPSLQNIQDITPPGAKFVEAHGFNQDSSKVIFTGDIETEHAWGPDIFVMDLATKSVTNLTKSPSWEEHAHYSPNGKKIVYMSSEPYPGTFLQTELMLMNFDGTDKRQLTHFNVPGYGEYVNEKSVPTRGNWSNDGRKLAVTVVLANKYPTSQMWILSFKGNCGN